MAEVKRWLKFERWRKLTGGKREVAEGRGLKEGGKSKDVAKGATGRWLNGGGYSKVVARGAKVRRWINA